ncbi:MAG: methyl-accepting chemotaxis protein [Chitinispirillales bacterium]|jgi:methyl-accepting chemotaxis protein|nr:methyl-accepting chemotaxis protein [Chitinispirillales bacterium]
MFGAINNVKISVKLIVGFVAVAAISVVVGVIGINSAAKMDQAVTRLYDGGLGGVSAASDIELAIMHIARSYRNMVIFNDHASLNTHQKTIDDAIKQVGELSEKLSNMATRDETRALLKGGDAHFKMYAEKGDRVVDFMRRVNVEIPDSLLIMLRDLRADEDILEGAAIEIAKAFDEVASDINDGTHTAYANMRNMLLVIIFCGLILGILIGFFLSQSISKPLAKAAMMIDDLKNGHLNTRLRMTREDEIGIMAKTMDTFANELQNVVVKTMKQISNGDLSANITPHDNQDEVIPALIETISALRGLIIDDGGKALQSAAGKDLTARVQREYRGEYAKMKDNINLLVSNLDDAIHQVDEAVAQVSSASTEISSGAQSLAEGANEQASSLEEISSSLEEMSSMTKQNADNSTQAKILVTETSASIGDANEAMARMGEAIKQIKTASDNTAKIIKTIDDIAFQTNLLALNAAVEAARAGEAGKGFAVVAEEVRNLAMRSAEAAKNTTDIIEDSVKNADSGVKITEDVANALEKAVERSTKVQDLIAEIAAASNEQAQGVEQINTAVAQMNQVTQQNAANSEESASAAEELSSQAAELTNMVRSFTISAAASGGGGRMLKLPIKPAPKPIGTQKMAAITDQRSVAVAPAGPTTKTIKAAVKSSEDIIPLDDDELMEF